MDGLRIVGGIGFVSAFFAAFFLAVAVISLVRDRARSRRFVVSSGVSDSWIEHLLRNGFPFFFSVSLAFLRVERVRLLFEDFCRVLGYKGYAATPKTLCSIYIVMSLCLCVLGWLLSSSLVLGVMACICFGFAFHGGIKRIDETRKVALREEIPEALQAMKACFCVGYSLQQTLQQVTRETHGPLKEVFAQAHYIFESGGSVSESLVPLKADPSEVELVFLATALEVQHKTGSSMRQVLDVARESVVDEVKLKRSLRTQTAQAKLSAQIVTIMPFILIGLFSLMSEGFLDPFFESPLGVVMLFVALVMQVAGVLMVRRLLRIEVA